MQNRRKPDQRQQLRLRLRPSDVVALTPEKRNEVVLALRDLLLAVSVANGESAAEQGGEVDDREDR